MDKDKHLLIGLVIFVGYYFLLSKFSLTQYLYYGITVFIGAVLPDVLDPWTKENSINHRKIWHSVNLFMPLLIIGCVSLILLFFSPKFLYLLFFVLGYLSHLIADSRFVGVHINGKSWSVGLKHYSSFFEGIKERYPKLWIV